MENENGTTIAEKAAPINDRGPENLQKNPDPVPNLSFDIKAATEDIEPKPVADVTKSDEIKKMNSLLKDLEGESDSDGLENIVKKASALATDGVANSETKITTTSISVNVKTTTLSTSSNSNKESETETNAIVTETTKVELVNDNADDVEMEDLTADVDMEDVTKVEAIAAGADSEKPAAPVGTSVEINKATKPTEFNSEKTENEQKIDDVEKNISNLFNGDEIADQHSVVKSDKPVTNSGKSGENQQQSDAVSTSTELQTNSSKGSATNDKDAECSKDLVSILTDDKPSSQAESTKTDDKEKDAAKVSTTDSASTTAQNKHLANIAKSITSTPSSSAVQSVFNSTPIQKQFDISSENVSTISEAVTDQSHCLGDKSTHQEIISSHSSSSNVNSSETTTANESDQQSSDALSRYAKIIGKYNGIGIGDTTDDTTASDISKPGKTISANEISSAASGISSSTDEKVYDINIWHEGSDLIYLCVQKQPQTKSSDLSVEHISSEGSVGSFGEPYALPVRSVTVTSSNSTLSTSSTSDASKLDGSKKPGDSTESLKKITHTVKGTLSLHDYLIEYLQKSRKTVSAEEDLRTPSRGRGRISVTTPSSTASANKRKRGVIDIEEEDTKSASAKKVKKEKAATEPVSESQYPERAVLARWVDKKFYPGRVVDQKPNDKFVVIFEDGAKKVLPEDNIVFGEGNVLPLEKEYVHALVKHETYEPGLVESVKTKGETVLYTVACESGTITVTASDIYLEDDQARTILSKQPNASASSPQPGFSGGINTRKDRRQKRYS